MPFNMPTKLGSGPGPTPQQLARQALDDLKKKANPKNAAGAQNYFKDAVRVFGLTTPEVRLLAKDYVLKVKDSWTIDQAVEFCELLLPDPHLEAKGLATLVFSRFVGRARPGHFLKMRTWLESDFLNNWASTDVFCGEVLTPFLERYPALNEKLKDWTRANNMWVRRASVVALVTPARRGKLLDLAYDVALRLLDSREDLMHKALGWLLREAGKKDMPRLERFLRANGPKIPRTSVRYAIERFDERKRKLLLAATSAKR